MFQTKIAEETKTQILCKYLFFSFENLSVLLDNVKNIYKAGHAMDINMAHALSIWIPKTTNTHSEYVILLVFPPLQWLRERTSMLLTGTLPVLLVILTSVNRLIVSSLCQYLDASASYLLPFIRARRYCKFLVRDIGTKVYRLLGAIARLRKAAISFFAPATLPFFVSVRMEQLGSH